MVKKSLIDNNEIDLPELLKTIWDGKIKLIIVTVISLSIIFVYNYQKPKFEHDKFSSSIIIKPSKNTEFLNFLPIVNYLNDSEFMIDTKSKVESLYSKKNELLISKEIILEKFINELLDYEEMIKVLRNNKNLNKKISLLSEKKKTQKLYDYAKSLTVKKIESDFDNDATNYKINFVWDSKDPEEGKEILDQTIKLVIKNLEKEVFKELEVLVNAKKNRMIFFDNKKIEYLLEQSLIAKQLGLAENSATLKIDQYLNTVMSKESFSFEMEYYLRGYKAIDREIEIIRNRVYEEIIFTQEKISNLKNNNIQWIDYNYFLTETTKLGQSNFDVLSLRLSILLSLVIGLIYVFISRSFQFYKVRRNT